MKRTSPCSLLGLVALLLAPAAARAEPAVTASVETTLATASGHIRQFAFDGDPKTYFASAKDAGADDTFTLRFDRPVIVKSIVATTGRPDGSDRLDAGALEASPDGTTFAALAKFAEGVARAGPVAGPVRALRLRPAADLKHPLVVREIAVASDPAVAAFRYPVEFVVHVDDAPEMKAWVEKAVRVCERQYPLLCDDLKSDGFQPRTVVTLTLRSNYRGVAATGGGRITASVRYFKAHPDDVGALVHETAHVVQGYRGRNLPGWLVEGIADYERFYRYEPGKARPPRRERAHYNGSYRVTAAFLNYLTEKYDRALVRKLNQALREGTYHDELFEKLTGKPLRRLDEEWRATLVS